MKGIIGLSIDGIFILSLSIKNVLANADDDLLLKRKSKTDVEKVRTVRATLNRGTLRTSRPRRKKHTLNGSRDNERN